MTDIRPIPDGRQPGKGSGTPLKRRQDTGFTPPPRAGDLAPEMLPCWCMCGLVTEHDLEAAEAAFPGIQAFYRELEPKPPTFLDLLRRYLQRAKEAEPTTIALEPMSA